MLDYYDPNSMFGKTVWRLTFKAWQYELTVDTAVGGNCKGLSTLECAIEGFVESLYNKETDILDTLYFKDKDGNTLEYDITEEEDPEEDLKNMLVRAELIGFDKEVT